MCAWRTARGVCNCWTWEGCSQSKFDRESAWDWRVFQSHRRWIRYFPAPLSSFLARRIWLAGPAVHRLVRSHRKGCSRFFEESAIHFISSLYLHGYISYRDYASLKRIIHKSKFPTCCGRIYRCRNRLPSLFCKSIPRDTIKFRVVVPYIFF